MVGAAVGRRVETGVGRAVSPVGYGVTVADMVGVLGVGVNVTADDVMVVANGLGVARMGAIVTGRVPWTPGPVGAAGAAAAAAAAAALPSDTGSNSLPAAML